MFSRVKRLLIAPVLASLASLASVEAADLPLPAVVSNADLDLTQRARAALAAQPQLRQVNLLISVIDGGMVVGGPVGSEEQRLQIESILRTVPGVRSLRMNCWLVTSSGSDTLSNMVRQRLDMPETDRARDTTSIPLPQRPNWLETREKKETRDSKLAMNLPPLWPSLRLPSGGNVTVQRYNAREMVLSEPVSIGDPRTPGYSPVPAPVPPAPVGGPTFPTIAPPSIPVTPGQDVASAAEEIRKSEPRFSRLNLQMRSGIVTINGNVNDVGDAWDLAELLRSVPGVDRIIMGKIEERR